jgi:ferrochelatase
MARIDRKDFDHRQPARIGVLLTVLGTPKAATAKEVRPWLRQFLSDPRVVEIPRLVWWLILNAIILLVRPRRSAQAYRKIWTDAGSPLAIHTRDQAVALQALLKERCGDSVLVEYAFRYGEPTIEGALQSLIDRGTSKLLVLPLFPQYSGATGGSIFDVVAADLSRRRWVPDFRFVSHYHDDPRYVRAVADSVRAHWSQHGRADRLLLSFHGMPRRTLDLGDPYYCECRKTARLLTAELGLAEDEIITTFQSRFLKAEWLKPYTDVTLAALPGEGVKSVQVVCPGFAQDCLETLEEIAMEGQATFLEAGGERFEYIPALNSEPGHVRMLADLACDHLQGWRVDPLPFERAGSD